MSTRTGEYLPGILNGLAGVEVVLVSLVAERRLPMSKEMAKPLGMLVIIAGMSLAVWATVHVREAILGEVEPRLDRLIKAGPYALVRHPVYLGMTIALLGAALAFRSWLGLISVFLLFLPSVVYRAKLEEKALARKFGVEWDRYAGQTGFVLPFIQKG